MVSKYCVPLKNLISYACIIHEYISYELNFDVQQFELSANYAQTVVHQSLVHS